MAGKVSDVDEAQNRGVYVIVAIRPGFARSGEGSMICPFWGKEVGTDGLSAAVVGSKFYRHAVTEAAAPVSLEKPLN